jgi:hypothetical protein
LKIKLNHIVILSPLLILLVILVQHTKLCYGLHSQLFTYIDVVIASLCLVFVFILDPSIIKLLPIPVITSLFIFIGSAVHAFEFHRAAILISFVGQLFTMYIFKNLSFNGSKLSIMVMTIYTLLMSLAALLFVVLGMQFIMGGRTFSSSVYFFRGLTGFFNSSSYLGYFATFVFIILFYTSKFNLKNFLPGLFLLVMLLLSSNRTPMAGLILLLIVSLLTLKMQSRILKWFLFSSFLLLVAGFFLAWWLSPYNYKIVDSGRLLMYYKTLSVIRDNYWFGASNLLLEPDMYIAEAHNFYLFTVAEYGVFVFLASMGYLLWFFWHSGRKAKIFLGYHLFYCFFHPAMAVGFSENHFLFVIVAIYLNHIDPKKQPVLQEDPQFSLKPI